MVCLSLSLLSVAALLCISHTNAFSTIGRSPSTSLSAGANSYRHFYALSAVSPGSENQGRATQLHQRREFVIQSIAAGIVSSVITPFVEPALADEDQSATPTSDDTTIDPSIDFPKITHKVYLDIKFAKYKPKQLVIGLFGDVMPKAVENFLTLSTANDNDPSYNGATFYRVLSGMSIQGGAIGHNNGKLGTSAFEGGKPFSPDNFKIRHTKLGLVSAVRGVGGEIDSRFFIQTEADAGWADDRYSAFGIVLEEEGTGGMDLVRRISRVDVKPPQNSPIDPVMIVGCGIFEG
mmetsp:Transcript_18071/g.32857  ORF Transcript_18071/g.32857 Transcript_18071/m.32857 type:complete len:292 (-) Transcript_18071:133-1008(-)|eukprot:CAMPEP_0201992390 /NCGR_PEP_ID=MMETSP0905-20130828/1007_1 /ASSEMBLY_ACC=CAM_ASM_000554 /TAXON_ID=420261 /ORGANISM="Thalassiosira antarctica, Strain CCMP982" /LENGTH=291 /DNA_ID=CAMNT_0048547075 /DNA_START=53 /DNA_END=928 /DNA_ORIENTATION=+